MNEPKPKPPSQFTPEWIFMEDPQLRGLQQCLDACYFGMEQETQDARNAARPRFASLWPEILKTHLNNKASRILLIKFLRKNFRTLDAGGIAKGNDSQISAMRSVNVDLIKNFGQEYQEVVDEME